MLIECSYCEARVDAKFIAKHDDPADELPPYRIFLLACPVCHNGLVGGLYPDLDDVWPKRLWPSPVQPISRGIPLAVRLSLREATSCFRAHAYGACAVMCGRALEGVCKFFKTKSLVLGQGLDELRKRDIIDARLMEWATELRKSRNIGAHDSGENVTKQDASDLLTFVNAICEYVFVLSHQFETYMDRKKTKPAAKRPERKPT